MVSSGRLAPGRAEVIDEVRRVAGVLTPDLVLEDRDYGGMCFDKHGTPVQDETLHAVLPDVEAAEALALRGDEAARLWGAVASVDERCRKLLRVVAFMDRPDYHSLSRDLDMPVGSIGPTRARCLAKVRTALMRGGQR